MPATLTTTQLAELIRTEVKDRGEAIGVPLDSMATQGLRFTCGYIGNWDGTAAGRDDRLWTVWLKGVPGTLHRSPHLGYFPTVKLSGLLEVVRSGALEALAAKHDPATLQAEQEAARAARRAELAAREV